MKPIIIGVTKDGKVDMTLEEFRKHMDDAYNQGYTDKMFLLQSTTTSDTHDNWWWKNSITCSTGATTIKTEV